MKKEDCIGQESGLGLGSDSKQIAGENEGSWRRVGTLTSLPLPDVMPKY